jgi:MarR family 2-MHQ and catechol resistance regulon transcriptional repressor
VQEFSITESNKLSDVTVLKTIAHLQKYAPNLDEAAVESHMSFFRAYAVYFDAMAKRYEELGLSYARFNVLRWLFQEDSNRLSLTELGARLEASVPNILRLVAALEEGGWLRRMPSEDDRRVTYVELTEDGLIRFRALVPDAVAIWEDLQMGLDTEEQLLLSHLLTKVRMSLLSRYLPGTDLVSYRIENRIRGNRKRR